MTRSLLSSVAAYLLAALAPSAPASAQQLLFHFPLDGSPDARGWGATESRLYLLDEGEGPTTVPGKVGDALYFRGNVAIAMPFELDMATYPKVTVTAWVKVDADSPGERTVFSSGNGNVPRLMIYTTKAAFHAARGVDMARTSITPDEWVFVAGTIDVEAARLQVFQGDLAQTRERIRTDNLYPPSKYRDPEDESRPARPYVFIGSHGFYQWRANQMAIDDVRVYAGVLSAEQIAALRAGQDPALADNASTPAFYSGGLTQESADDLAARRAAGAAPDITYASEEEALAAQERREREAAEAELARQQNELEAAGQVETVAQPPYYPIGQPAFSAIAGRSGSNSSILDLESVFLDQIALVRSTVVFQETCSVRINSRDRDIPFERTIHVCDNPALNIDRDPDFSAAREEVRFHSEYIGSIKACWNVASRDGPHNNLSLHGLQVAGGRIADDGSYVFTPVTKTATFRGFCEEWSGQMLCPTSPVHMATGVVVHYNDNGNARENDEVVGLQLICRKIGTR